MSNPYINELHAAGMTPSLRMDLRDYFAAFAIGPILATPWFQHMMSSQKGSIEYATELAEECYNLADAMMAERARRLQIEGDQAQERA